MNPVENNSNEMEIMNYKRQPKKKSSALINITI